MDEATPTEDVIDQEYRSLSVLALVALVLGVLSLFYLVSALLIVLPLMAIGLGLLAARRVGANPDVLTGRPLALAGAALGVLALTAGLTRGEVSRRLLAEQSRPVAEEWIERALAGDAATAYELSRFPAERGQPPPGATAPPRPGELMVSPEQALGNAIAEHAGGEAFTLLAGLGPDTALEPIGASGVAQGRRGTVSIGWLYRAPSAATGQSPAPQVLLVMERNAPTGGQSGKWRVADARLAPSL